MIYFEPNCDIFFKCSCCGRIVNNGSFYLRLCPSCFNYFLINLSCKFLRDHLEDLKNKQDSN